MFRCDRVELPYHACTIQRVVQYIIYVPFQSHTWSIGGVQKPQIFSHWEPPERGVTSAASGERSATSVCRKMWPQG